MEPQARSYHRIVEGAISLLIGGEKEKALSEYEKAIKLDPGRERGYCGAALASGLLKNYSDACARMGELVRASPGASYAHLLVGYVMERRGERDEALAAYGRVLEEDPQDVEALVGMHRVLEAAGRKEEGAKFIDEARTIAPAEVVDEWQKAEFAEVSVEGLKYDEYTGFPPGWRQIMEMAVFGRLMDVPLVESALRTGLEISDVDELSEAANKLADQGMFDEALKVMRTAIARDPDFAYAYSASAMFLVNLGRYEEAVACVDEVLRIRPDDVEDLGVKGMLLEKMGRYDQAIACYDRILRVDPGETVARYLKCGLLAIAGDAEGLAECYREALASEPSDKESADIQKSMRREYRELMRCSDAAGSLAAGFAKFVRKGGVGAKPRWGRKA